jgi:Porphobilinogen deaminase
MGRDRVVSGNGGTAVAEDPHRGIFGSAIPRRSTQMRHRNRQIHVRPLRWLHSGDWLSNLRV